MRIAILSDIHSNYFVLKAVIDDIKQRRVELTINLGDSLYGPILPRATYDLLMSSDFINIRGNQDRQIYEADQKQLNISPTMNYVISDLGNEPLDWMKSLPPDKQLNEKIYLCHGSPGNDSIYLLEDIKSGFPRLRSNDEIVKLLNGQLSELICCAHTHIPRSVMLKSGQLIVNSGSVGLPAYTDDEPVVHSMENYSPYASYVIIEEVKSGWNAEHLKIPYDYQKSAEEAKKHKREDWAYFLTTGRGLK
jgi:predicted phosphodiesterase